MSICKRFSAALANRRRNAQSTRRGVTLVEMLIAMTISLVLVYSMVLVFESISNSISDHRSTIEMSSQLRMVAHRLQLDLENVTVPVRPWADPEGDDGYFEIYEGPGYDWDGDARDWDKTPFLSENEVNWNARIGVSPDPTVDQSALSEPLLPNTVLGDPDDLIAATVRSVGEPFRGRYRHPDDAANAPPRIVESNLAEVIWWTAVHDINRNNIFDADDRLVLFRRTVLVRPDLALRQDSPNLISYYEASDISARISNTGQLVSNSLEDLSKRENRFLHVPKVPDSQKGDNLTISPSFPHENMLIPSRRAAYLLPSFLNDQTLLAYTAPVNNAPTISWSKYVIASNFLAFDVRVFDPEAPLFNLDGEPVGPGDPGFATIIRANGQTPPIGYGAFVDLAYGVRFDLATASVFSNLPDPKSKLFRSNEPFPTYDTWSMHYEYDGLDQNYQDPNGGGVVDEGTNGFDENGVGGVDDEMERETAPPYPVPLSGIQVTLRVDEPGTRQIRQSTVVVDFTPE